MKGTLHKTESGWHVINMQATLNGPLFQSLPLLPSDALGLFIQDTDSKNEGQEVEFEIVDFPINSISKYAKLVDKATRPLTEDDAWITLKEGDITVNFKPMPEFDEPAYPTRLDQLREQAWEEVIREFYRDAQKVPMGAPPLMIECWLAENYNPPTKKQD